MDWQNHVVHGAVKMWHRRWFSPVVGPKNSLFLTLPDLLFCQDADAEYAAVGLALFHAAAFVLVAFVG